MTRDEFMHECEVFVRAAVRRNKSAVIGQPVGIEDLAQQGRAAAVDAWCRLDPERSRLEKLDYAKIRISGAVNRMAFETWMDSSDAPIGAPSIAEVGRWRRRESRKHLDYLVTIAGENNAEPYVETIPAPGDPAEDVRKGIDAAKARRALGDAVRSMEDLVLVRARFGEDEATLDDLADAWGVSRQAVQQRESRILARARAAALSRLVA